MAYSPTLLRSWLALTALVGTLGTAQGASDVVSTAVPASSALDFRIIIPPVIRLLDDSAPAVLSLDGAAGSPVVVDQRLVLMSTLRRGFCLSLHMASPLVHQWQLGIRSGSGLTHEGQSDSHRFCAHRAGRYELSVQHTLVFRGSTAAPQVPPIVWPVRLELVSEL